MLADNEHTIMFMMGKLGFNVPLSALLNFLMEKGEETVKYAFYY